MNAELEDRVHRARQRLGVGPRAGAAQIRRSFRLLSKELHPDRGGDQAAFEEVQAAYELLRSIGTEPAEQWFLDDEEGAAPVRVLYDSRPRPIRRSFQQLFTEALRDSTDVDGPSGTGA